MFVFLAIHIDQHPDYNKLGAEATKILMSKLWKQLAEHLVLFAPGFGFDAHGPHNIGAEGIGFFRISFSSIAYDHIHTAMGTFAKVLTEFMGH